MTIIIQAVESEGRSGGRKFPAIGFTVKKSPDLAFSNVDRYANPNLKLNSNRTPSSNPNFNPSPNSKSKSKKPQTIII